MRITSYNIELNENKLPLLVKENTKNYPKIDSVDTPDKVVNMLNDIFRASYQAEEHAYLIALDTKCKVIGIFNLSHGTINSSFLNTREIFLRLCICGAANFIIAHNHPSGDSHPSITDIETTEKIKQAGKLMGINLLNHIIIGDNNSFSFHQNELIE